MQCPACQTEARRFGKDRNGNQRFQCQACRKTFSDRPARPLGEMRLPLDKAVMVIKLLTEGCSVRSTVRLSGVAKATVLALLAVVGEKCADLMAQRFVGLPVNDVQVDEVWGFVGMKEKTKKLKSIESDDLGDAYCFVGIERTSKLIMAWHLGKRGSLDTHEFMDNLNKATTGRFQLTTDGWRSYPEAVTLQLDREVDFAQLVKQFGKEPGPTGRYSPPEVVGVESYCCTGTPDPKRVCTSHVERQNLTIRMQTRRMTRLTNAFSKKWANHWAALAIHFAQYNFCRVHGTLKQTPAMAAGLTDHPWSILELLTASTQS